MNKEEQEAIEYWKRNIELYHYNTQLASEHYAQVILNYISKLEKKAYKCEYFVEVAEALHKENEELKDYKERTEHTIMLAKATQRENEILKGTNEDLTSLYLEMKDKIRDKIKECEENEKLFEFIQNESYMRKMNKDFIILLKELLEE